MGRGKRVGWLAPAVVLLAVAVEVSAQAAAAPRVCSIQDLGVPGSYPSWSPEGDRLAFERGGDLFVLSLDDGAATPVAHHPSLDETPVWSPDGEILFASEREGELDVFQVRPDGSGLRRLTTDPTDDDHPRYTSDGSRIVFNSKRHDGETYQIWVMDADGGGARRLTYHYEWDSYPSLSADGSRLLWRRVLIREGRRDSEIFLTDLASGEVSNLTDRDGFDGYPVWSPDEAWVAFASDRDSPGMDQLFVMRTDGSDWIRLNELEEGVQYARPSWSADGRRIAATRQDAEGTTLVVVELEWVAGWATPSGSAASSRTCGS